MKHYLSSFRFTFEMTSNLILATTLQILAALFMAFVWAAFLRKLDIFKPEKWWKIIVAFVVGCLTPLSVLLLHEVAPDFNTPSSGGLLGILQFFTLNVGFVEELAKFLGFLLIFLVFRKWFDEDINFFVYASMVGLGFATLENCLYFFEYGIHLVYIRGLMCAVGHMTGTALIASLLCVGLKKGSYNIILYPAIGFLIAGVLHGLYDTVLSLGLSIFGHILAMFIFMLEFEIWAQYSNNLLNQSKHYKNNVAVDRSTLQKFLIAAFIVAGAIQLIGLGIKDGWGNIILKNFFGLATELILTIILVARITRYTVIPGHWKKVYPQLPFVRVAMPQFMAGAYGNGGTFAIRGDEFNEYPFTTRINKLSSLIPFKTARNTNDQIYQCWIIDKVFLGKKKELYYLCELAGSNFTIPNAHPTHFLIKPKLEGTKYFEKWPIIGIITISAHVDLKNIPLTEARFLRWSVFKDDQKEPLTQTWKEMIL